MALVPYLTVGTAIAVGKATTVVADMAGVANIAVGDIMEFDAVVIGTVVAAVLAVTAPPIVAVAVAASGGDETVEASSIAVEVFMAYNTGKFVHAFMADEVGMTGIAVAEDIAVGNVAAYDGRRGGISFAVAVVVAAVIVVGVVGDSVGDGVEVGVVVLR